MKLNISKASKSFGSKKIFSNLSLEVACGEMVGLFGRNGSGKSTLLKMMFGTLRADNIQMCIDANPIHPKEVIPKQLIGFLPQHRFLPPHMTIRNIVPLYFKDEQKLDQIFYAPNVADFDHLRAGALSEGQLKYIELLLIAHLSHPFLLLDEPFSMTDPLYKDLVKELLHCLKETKGILITDHYYQDVLQITDRNYLINNGKISEVSDESDLRKQGYLPG